MLGAVGPTWTMEGGRMERKRALETARGGRRYPHGESQALDGTTAKVAPERRASVIEMIGRRRVSGNDSHLFDRHPPGFR